MPQTIVDDEFGEMIVKRTSSARSVRIRVGTDGRFVISAPRLTPMAFIKLTISSSRTALRKLSEQSPRATLYQDGQAIGHQHRLRIVPTSMVKVPTIKVERAHLLVQLPPGSTLESSSIQQQIRDTVAQLLRKEAKVYLPDRLAVIADRHGFHYERVRFSHSGGRWGSCSSTGTISLNIALMKLPLTLIDYVLAHELAHTRQMNHSPAFWDEVRQIDPLYKLHRRQLKNHSPIL